MHALESLFKVCHELLVGTFGRTGPRYHHVIVARPQPRWIERADGGSQAPANAISHHGIADLLRDRESNTRSPVIALGIRPQNRFHDKEWRGPPQSTSDAEELGALLEGIESHCAQSSLSRVAL